MNHMIDSVLLKSDGLGLYGENNEARKDQNWTNLQVQVFVLVWLKTKERRRTQERTETE